MSQPRVFISLGCTGQVVERRGTASNSREAGPRSGSKRSIRNGLRIYPHDSFVSNKRQRGDGTYWGTHENREKEMGLTPKDLRLKLLRRRMGQMNQKVVKSAVPSPSNGRFQSRPEAEARESFHQRQISNTKFTDHIHIGDSSLNEAGARSSDIHSSRAVAPLIDYDGQQRLPSISTSDGRNGVFYASMPIGFTPATLKGTVENAKPVRQLASMSGIGERNSQCEVPLTVSGLLHSLGLEKYEIYFRAEEVDMAALKQMGDKDFKDLGIPMGPRKKILLSLWPRSKQQPPRVLNVKYMRGRRECREFPCM